MIHLNILRTFRTIKKEWQLLIHTSEFQAIDGILLPRQIHIHIFRCKMVHTKLGKITLVFQIISFLVDVVKSIRLLDVSSLLSCLDFKIHSSILVTLVWKLLNHFYGLQFATYWITFWWNVFLDRIWPQLQRKLFMNSLLGFVKYRFYCFCFLHCDY